uniref:Uncharacterized protein n=1 Tax=Avena sativa TaxID=4498 RepID=A0ACD5XVE8_AVESA
MGFPEGKLKDLLIACARAVEDDKDRDGIDVMVVELRRMVSKSGDPFERLGAYMLEALVARMDSSGLSVYKDLKAEEEAKPSDLMSYMHLLYEVCPQFIFARMSANGAIAEAVKGQATVHIIDFNISDGSQWVTLLQALGARPGGAPSIRITGISDTVAARSRNSKLELTERRLSYLAERLNVPFEFHAVAISGDQVEEGHLAVIPRPGGSGEQEEKETVVVNFPMVLDKNRDRILKLVKSLSPRVLTLVEPECNTNSANFFHRFVETLDYHAAVFESMDVAFPRKGETRMNMEQHFLWRQIVNIVACEGSDRVERHEHFVQWKARLLMAGFTPHPLSSIVNNTIRTLLQSYHSSYRVDERDEVLYLGWKDRTMVVTSAWH